MRVFGRKKIAAYDLRRSVHSESDSFITPGGARGESMVKE